MVKTEINLEIIHVKEVDDIVYDASDDESKYVSGLKVVSSSELELLARKSKSYEEYYEIQVDGRIVRLTKEEFKSLVKNIELVANESIRIIHKIKSNRC